MTILATLVYLIDINNNSTLMIHRVNKKKDLHKAKYNGLGGKLELGETPEECAKREVFEESGLNITKLCFKGHLLFPKFDEKLNDWLVFVYTTNHFTGELIKINREGNLSWIKNDQLLKLNLWEGDRVFLKELFTKNIFSGTFHYENKNLIDYNFINNLEDHHA